MEDQFLSAIVSHTAQGANTTSQVATHTYTTLEDMCVGIPASCDNVMQHIAMAPQSGQSGQRFYYDTTPLMTPGVVHQDNTTPLAPNMIHHGTTTPLAPNMVHHGTTTPLAPNAVHHGTKILHGTTTPLAPNVLVPGMNAVAGQHPDVMTMNDNEMITLLQLPNKVMSNDVSAKLSGDVYFLNGLGQAAHNIIDLGQAAHTIADLGQAAHTIDVQATHTTIDVQPTHSIIDIQPVHNIDAQPVHNIDAQPVHNIDAQPAHTTIDADILAGTYLFVADSPPQLVSDVPRGQQRGATTKVVRQRRHASPAPSGKGRRPKKTKKYEIEEPFDDPEEEQKRRNAINAKKNRESKKKAHETLRSNLEAKRREKAMLMAEQEELKQKEQMLSMRLLREKGVVAKSL